MKKILFTILIITLVLAANLFFDHKQVQAQGKRDLVDNEVLVKFKDGVSAADAAEIHRKLGTKVKEVIPGINVQVVETHKGIGETVSAFARESKVEFVEPNYIAYAVSTDPYYSDQWALDNNGGNYCSPTTTTTCTGTGVSNADINAPQAWLVTTGSSSVKVAVLDTGVDPSHPDLAGKVADNYDFTGSNDYTDHYGHGTHVSGIIAGKANNNEGIAGIAYDTLLLNGKVLNNDGAGAYSWIANGIIWATDNGAKVINMSLGGTQKSRTLENAVKFAWNHGVVIVAAAGNSNNPSPTYPAKYDQVLAVAATNNKDQKAYFSSYGDWVDIAAPGENILSTFPTYPFKIAQLYGRSQDYDFASGTSMSTPVVAGVAALVWDSHPGATNSDVRALLESTANPIPGTGTYWQNGRVDAEAAVNATVSSGGGSGDTGGNKGGKKCDSPPCPKTNGK